MKKTVIILIAVVVLLGAGWGTWKFFNTTWIISGADAPYIVPPLSTPYTNSTYNFSVTLPQGFAASEAADPANAADTIVFQDAHADGIQIVVTPFDEDTGGGYTLTQERILGDVPDLSMSDVQSVQVGDHYTGVAFKSNNPAFGGSTREVWFVFRGNLYQISTYEKFDDLLKAVFGTWQFF